MNLGRITYKLRKSLSPQLENRDGYFNINLKSELKNLPPGNINRVVNLGEQFDKEREESKRYRIITTLRPLFSNVLFNLSGEKNQIDDTSSYGYETFDGEKFKTNQFDNIPGNDFGGSPNINYEQSVTKHLKEIDGWFGFYDPDVTKASFCEFYDLEPKRERFEMSSFLPVKNWEFTITYPYNSDKTHYLVNGGLLITTAQQRTLGGIPMVVLGSATPHNLIVGDTVRLSNMPNQNMNGDFTVLALGFESGDDTDTHFVVNINPNNAVIGAQFSFGRMKRLYFGYEVEYYLRKFKKIKGFNSQEELGVNDYESYPLAFSKTIYSDQIYELIFNDDIDVDGLTDNLGRPLSELYLTMLKTNGGNFFTKVKSGFDLKNTIGNTITNTVNGRSVSNIRKIHSASLPLAEFESHTPLENDVTINNSEFYGDICEYSKYEARETVLLDVTHRFNTIDRETTTARPISSGSIDGLRNEGYLYKPHHLIKIREFSAYIEQGDESTAGIPDYAEDLGDNRYLWRDLLSLGFNDGQEETLDYPFLNGCHYIYKNLCITTRRQDPFGNFDLLYAKKFPRDIPGDGLSDAFTIKSSGDEC